MELTKDIFVSAGALAGMLEVTSERVYQLKKIGLPCNKETGKFPVVTCLLFMLRLERKRNETLASATSQEKFRLMRERAERAALENQKLRNKVIDVEGITQQTMEITQQLKGGLLGLPGRVCHTLEGKNAAEIRQLLDIEIKNMMNSLAEELENMIDTNKENGKKFSEISGGICSEDKMVSQRG